MAVTGPAEATAFISGRITDAAHRGDSIELTLDSGNRLSVPCEVVRSIVRAVGPNLRGRLLGYDGLRISLVPDVPG